MSSPTVSESCKRKNVLEWTVFGLSLAILAGVIATLIFQAFTITAEPARLTIELGTPLVSHGQIRIPLSVTNEGDLPALGVEIEVTGTLKGKEQASSVPFDYISHRARREGWVSFPGEVIPLNLSARVLGYADP